MAKAPQSIVSKVRKAMRDDPGMRGAIAKQSGAVGSPKIPADEYVALLYECGGSAYQVAKRTGMTHRAAALRRDFLERALGIELPRGRPEAWRQQSHRQRIDIAIEDGVILAGSDAHCWDASLNGTAQAAFVDFNRRIKPAIVVLNGDGLDGAKISRHSRIGWDQRPTVKAELDALGEFLEEVRKANPNAKYYYTLGNHSLRYETYLSSNAPEVEGLKGTTLAEYIPGWTVCMALMFNGNFMMKHRHKSGIHNAWQNVRDAGIHIATGHTHRQVVRPWSNFGGTWYGVDLGMLAPVNGPQFDYCEQGTTGLTDWRSGFGVFTTKNANLMPPDLATVTNEEEGEIYFRGQSLHYEL